MAERHFFGTDGIRGLANLHPLTPEFVLKLGRAAATVLSPALSLSNGGAPAQRPACLIGRDTRASGTMLENALAAGLNSMGVDVVLGGVMPTPATAFLAVNQGCAFSAVISASHNPAQDNGIKFFGTHGFKLTDGQEAAMEELLLGEPELEASLQLTGGQVGRTLSATPDFLAPYLDHCAGLLGARRLDGWRIVVDAANGAAIPTTAAVLEQSGAQVIRIHHQPDGMNINAQCGCLHPQDLEQAVREHGANLGIAHDGDADRVILCDETGRCLEDADDLLAIAATDYLQRGALRNKLLITTVMSNGGVSALVRASGGTVLRSGVGDRQVLEMMQTHGSNLGGEQSGHLIFLDHSTTGDGLVAALEIIRIMADRGQPLSELCRPLRRQPQLKRNLRVACRVPLEDLPTVTALVQQTVREVEPDGQVLIRYSGTEPLLRILLEGPDLAFLQGRMEEITKELQRALA